jgi:two-component system, OmpR family, alkaline phosphatase synthesis response regulator PhoP
VRARLREKGEPDSLSELRFSDVRVDFARFRLTKGKREHLLTHLEVEILRLFASRPDEPIRRAEILDRAWGDAEFPTERTVDNFIVKLRKKIEDDPSAPRFLVTVHGYGYRFAPKGI